MSRAFKAIALIVALVGTTLGSMVVTIGVLAIVEPEPATALGPPQLVEEAAAAGIVHTYAGGFTHFVGGGVAAFDCDDDGFQDLFFAGGSAPAALYRNDSVVGGPLRFSPRPDPTTDLTDVVGAYPIDVDADGHIDLAVLRLGENVLLRGLGDCRFERANETWGIDGGDAWTAAFSATWEGDATLPTLAFGNYLQLDENHEPVYACADSALVRPAAGSSRYDAAITLSPGYCTLSVLFSDWDRSGRRDLRMANDQHYYRDGEEQLWRIEPGAPPRQYTTADGWQPLVIWGMGLATADLTGDGYPEVFITSQGDNKLQTLADGPDQPTYTDIALKRGANAHRPFTGDALLPSTAWHPEFADVNNDGYLDLYISKGNVDAQEGYAIDDPSDLLLGQPDGTFVEAAREARFLSFGRSRGGALVDLNLDGLLDLVEVERTIPVKVYRNVGTGTPEAAQQMGHWLGLRLQQAGGDRDAIGAWLEVRVGDRTVEREVTLGGGHASGQLGWLHVGLGSADRAEVRVTWPDGEVGPWQTVEADGFTILERGAEPRAWTPAPDRAAPS